MKTRSNAEKEWLHKLTAGKTAKKEESNAPKKTAEAQVDPLMPKKKECRGFKDVAGMDELKELVTEGFINVLNNRECAKAYGITPPKSALVRAYRMW